MDILRKYIDARNADKDEEALKIIQQIPLPPHLAKALIHAIGEEEAFRSGFDFSESGVLHGTH